MRTMIAKAIVCCVVAFVALLSSCATETAPLRIEKGLPPERLAPYYDGFDRLRDDLWEVVGYIRKADVRSNFKLGDVGVHEGQLKMKTKTGCFSRAALQSRFYFRGDFDVQIDCHVQFLDDVRDMDQIVGFFVVDKAAEMEDEKLENMSIGLFKQGNNPAAIFSAYMQRGKWNQLNRTRIDRFRGTLRTIRIEKNFTTLYKNEGESEWKKMSTISLQTNDIFISIIAMNYDMGRTSIGAKKSFSTSFDNFRINAAEKIVESEI